MSSEVTLGLLAAPGLTHELAKDLADELPDALSARFPDLRWKVVVAEEPLAGAGAGDPDVVQVTRRRMLDEGWDLSVCLTDLPLLLRRRPVTAHVSVALGIGVVSVPALGPVGLEHRVYEAVLRVVDRLVRERRGDRAAGSGRVVVLGQPRVQEGGKVRYVTGVVRGNLRLLFGMVRANRPWRLIAGLSRALTAALGTATAGLASPGVWRIADGMGWTRAVALSAGAVIATIVSLVVAHRLWERVPHNAARDRVALFNLATVLTVAIGVLTLYLALLAIAFSAANALIVHHVFASQLGHPVGVAEYLRLAMLVSLLATIGGALGSALESDQAVREAAYGYRPDDG